MIQLSQLRQVEKRILVRQDLLANSGQPNIVLPPDIYPNGQFAWMRDTISKTDAVEEKVSCGCGVRTFAFVM